MPSKNIVKIYASDSYYHIYNRGVEKRLIFMDDRDYRVFLSYFKVALSKKLLEETKKEALTVVEEARLRRLHLHNELDLLAYCLMPNHFHLLVYQYTDPYAIKKLMQSVMTGYVRYFNKRHKRVGGLFQGPYKASLIDSDDYLWHISRYIHLNPKEWEVYSYSSYKYYTAKYKAEWIKPKRILELHESSKNYNIFLKDYRDYQNSINTIKDQLANPLLD